MHIEELATQVVPLSRELIAAAQKRFDNLIKPVGSLAQLEEMTSRYAAIVGSSDKQLVVVPSVRILLLWGTERCKDQIEAILLGKAPVLALAEQVRAKVLPQFLTSENMYDYLEEGAMLTSEYVREEKAGVLCQGCFSPSPAPERWRPLVAEEDGLRFLEELGEPEISAMAGSILQAAGLRIPVLLDGVANLYECVTAMRQKTGKMLVPILMAVLTIGLGCFLIFQAMGVAKTVIRLIGFIILYNGVSDLYIASRIRTKDPDQTA